MQSYGCNSLCNAASYSYCKGFNRWYKNKAEEAVTQYFALEKTMEDKLKMVETRMEEISLSQKERPNKLVKEAVAGIPNTTVILKLATVPMGQVLAQELGWGSVVYEDESG